MNCDEVKMKNENVTAEVISVIKANRTESIRPVCKSCAAEEIVVTKNKKVCLYETHRKMHLIAATLPLILLTTKKHQRRDTFLPKQKSNPDVKSIKIKVMLHINYIILWLKSQ